MAEESKTIGPQEGETKAGARAPSAAGAAASSNKLGKYELQRKLGAGGMGTVYLAVDTILKRTVALKILPKESAQNPTLVKRFESEAQSAAQLRHDNIISVYDFGTADGYLFIALEFVDGKDVHQMLAARGTLEVRRSIEIVRQTAVALHHAYERGIVHRDIKPSNIMVDERGIVKLADMGLARSVDDTVETGITRAGTTVGTVDYMAPEQARDSKAADIRSDIYSLGCTLYHMLVGRVPFPKGSLTNKLMAHATRERPDPRAINPRIPQSVADVVMRMMERSPKKRYQTPAEVIEALEFLADLPLDDASDVSEGSFGEDLVGIAVASPSADTTESPRPRSTGTGLRSRRERAPRREQRSSPRHRRRKSGSRVVLPIVAAAAILGLLVAGGIYWANSGSGTEPADVADSDPVDPDPGPVDPGPVDPGPVDPGPVDPALPGPGPAAVVDPRITIGRATERAKLPGWIAELLLPEEAAAPPPRFGLESVEVGNVDSARYRDLGHAIAQSNGTGRAIRLAGPGPFLLDPVALDGGRHVVVAGDPGKRSLVWLRNGERASSESLLEFTGTSLTLVDVDLVVEGGTYAGNAPNAIAVRGGDLVLRRCSVTVQGDRPRAVFRVSGSVAHDGPGRGPRVLLDRTLVRGNAIRVLESDAPALQFASSNALLVTGTGPVLELGGAGRAAASPNGRRIEFFSSTLYAGRLGMAIDVPDGTPPPPTRVVALNSVVATRESRSTLLETRDWPIDGKPGSPRFGLPGLVWTTTASVYAGWDHSIHATADGIDRTEDGYRGWQQSIEPDVVSLQFPARWPSGLLNATATIDSAEFDTRVGNVLRLTADDGAWLGADVTLTRAPSAERIDAGRALATRPFVPSRLVRTPNGSPIAFDTDKDGDLGHFLASANLPDPAHVVVTGSGVRRCSPIFVENRSLRLEFRSSGNEPLVIDPRGARVEPADRRKGRTAAFITLRGGTLEIVGGSFRLSGVGTGVPVEWFLHATGGSFAIHDCAIAAPVAAGTFRDVIQWDKPGEGGARTGGRAMLVDSVVVSSQPIFSGALRHRSLTVRNCVLVARDSMFDLDVAGFEPSVDAIVDLRDSTLATGDTFFDVRGSDIPSMITSPLRVFADRCVFGPPAETGMPAERGPILFAVSAPMIRQRQIDWRARDNAYWSAMHAHLVDVAATPPPEQSFDDWRTFWADREVRPLASEEAIRYVNGTPAFDDIVSPTFTNDADRAGLRSRFALDPGSTAGGWRLDGGPIGAGSPKGRN